jgi:hypothetical protein
MSTMLDVVHDSGEMIGRSHAPESFETALADLLTITDVSMQGYVLENYARIDGLLAEEPFNVGVVREQTIRLGVLPVLYAKESKDCELSQLFAGYLEGITAGGFPRWEAKPLVGRAVACEIDRLLGRTSYAAHNSALALEEQAIRAGVFGIRDITMVTGAVMRHTWRHRAPRHLRRWARSLPG